MQVTTIDQLPEIANLTDNDRLIINQADTSRANLSQVKEYMQGDLPSRIDNAINEVKEYTDNLLSGRNEWLPPVNKVSELTTAGLDNKINYLCKVVADTESGVYQCVAGWEDEPVWALFDNTVDLVNEQELENGITAHNIDTGAHEDIRQSITDGLTQEVNDRNTAISSHNSDAASHADIRTSVTDEAQARAQGDIDTLSSAKSYADGKAAGINSILDGVQALTLEGELLTRVINGTTPVAKNLFDPFTFVEDKTLISDINGTIGVVRGQDSAEITVETLSVSPMSSNEPTLLGNVNTFADLPETVNEAALMGWNTPRVDDYARVLRDETNDNATVEWYIETIVDGVITWANPVILNTSDYQAQTTANDAGKVLTGGAIAGTFGASIPIDVTPTVNSGNLITSGAVFKYGYKEVSHDDLLTLISANGLTVGTLYKITDYKTVYIQPETNLDSSLTPAIDTQPEPLIVIATSPNTLDVKAYSPLFPQDEIWYDVTKNSAKYAWSSPNDKGQIFRRIDNQKNDFRYDIRNIKFRRWRVSQSLTAWSAGTTAAGQIRTYSSNVYLAKVQNASTPSDGTDWMLICPLSGNGSYIGWSSSSITLRYGNGSSVSLPMSSNTQDFNTFTVYSVNTRENQVGLYFTSNKNTLNNMVFLGDNIYENSIEGQCRNNSIGANFSSNSIGANFSSNSIGANFSSNSIGANFSSNSIGANFSSNSIGAYFSSNSIGANFSYNSIGAYFSSNSIGAYFSYNSIGANFNSNSIGADFSSNSIGADFSYNSIGANFSSNSIGAYFSYNSIGANFNSNSIGAYFSYNSIGANFSSNSIGANSSYNSIGAYFSYNRFGDNFAKNNLSGYTSAVDDSTAVRNNVFENGISFVSTKNWGTADDANLRNDNTMVYGKNGTRVYRYSFASGTMTSTQVVA